MRYPSKDLLKVNGIQKRYLFWQIPRRVIHYLFLDHQALRNFPSSLNSECARDRRINKKVPHLFTGTSNHQITIGRCQFRNRSGQAVNGERRTSIYDLSNRHQVLIDQTTTIILHSKKKPVFITGFSRLPLLS